MKTKSLKLLSLSLFLFFNAKSFEPEDLNKLLSGEKNLVEANLEKAYLAAKNLSNVNFSQANLLFASLNSTNLEGADFTGANLTGADLSAAKDLKNSFNKLTQNTNLFFQTAWCGIKKAIREKRPSWYATKKSFQSLAHSLSSFAYFLNDITFQTNSNSIYRNRIGTNFSHTNARFANFSNTYLMNANFENANLHCANFKNAILFCANFKNAILDFANLKNIQLEFADVQGASFKNAKGLTIQQKLYLRDHGAINVISDADKEEAEKLLKKNIKQKLLAKKLKQYAEQLKPAPKSEESEIAAE